MDDTWIHGWSISRRRFCIRNIQGERSSHLHRSTYQNKVWISHHHGDRKEMNDIQLLAKFLLPPGDSLLLAFALVIVEALK
eukprot:m.15262 g.15262  ORF g.15262 m.15262 type:complete len:81 (-) comp7817_c0_seq1:75-317(-)